jgi:glucose-1-phosphate thymidylyltransferase
VVQEERRGIGHAIDLTRGVADTGEPLLIVLGDTIVKSELGSITGLGANALGVKAVEDPRRFGVCELTDGKVTKLVEKPADPPSNLALVGLYYLQDGTALFDAIRRVIDGNIMTKGEYQITDALQMMIEDGTVFVPFDIDQWFDCGKPEAMLETNRELLEDISEVPSLEGSIIIPPVSISPGANIVSSIIGPYVSIADGVAVDHSIVRDSILAEGATVKHSMLERSLVGANAVVEGAYKKLDVGDSSEIIIS